MEPIKVSVYFNPVVLKKERLEIGEIISDALSSLNSRDQISFKVLEKRPANIDHLFRDQRGENPPINQRISFVIVNAGSRTKTLVHMLSLELHDNNVAVGTMGSS